LELKGTRMKVQESRPIIWIVGNNVLMDGVVACLEERQITNLVRWDVCETQLDADLPAGQPILIIFPLDTPGSPLLLDLLKKQPGLHLLGIDQNCNQVIVLNSVMRETRTMTDLYQIIEEISGIWE
jgi:hypothetical protein